MVSISTFYPEAEIAATPEEPSDEDAEDDDEQDESNLCPAIDG